MNQPLQGKHAIITGGGTGIGAAIADKLTELGANVTLMGRRLDVLDKKASELSGARAITVDVSNEESVKQALDEAGDYDILINNAGFAESAPANRTSLDHWEKTISINLTGVFLCSKHAVDMLRKKSYGRIITIASTAGLTGYGYVSAYCAAKHGAIGFTKSLALEMARTSTTVNAVCPGYTETAILSDTIANIVGKTGCSEEQAKEQLLADNPQKKFIQPNEVANITAALCFTESNSITGQAIAVDGGETA